MDAGEPRRSQAYGAREGSARTTSPRDVLNELKWHRHALERARITYVHRGAPGDERSVGGAEVVGIGASFFELASVGPESSMIPYHRVLRIEVDGALVWARQQTPPP